MVLQGTNVAPAPRDTLDQDAGGTLRAELAVVLPYFGLYVAYLFVYPESEAVHWVTLVLLPVLMVLMIRRRSAGRWAIADTLASMGLRRDRLRVWIGPAIGIGLLISVAQLLVGGHASEAMDLFRSGRALYLYPLVIVLLLFTAGTTEEVLFRGVMQTRLVGITGSPVLGVLLVSVMFSLYHIPYAYLNPNWPSAGNLLAATGAAFVNGMLGGVVLGWVYEKSGHNLMASIIVHTLINSLPAMTVIKFQFGG